MRKGDFPIFSAKEQGSFTYFDSAATSHKPEVVINAISQFYREENSSVGRGIYPSQIDATERVEGVRESVARFIGASKEEIVFL